MFVKRAVLALAKRDLPVLLSFYSTQEDRSSAFLCMPLLIYKRFTVFVRRRLHSESALV